jgi:septum formation protein
MRLGPLLSKTSLWIGAVKPVLASKSASRRLLLESAGIEVDVEAAAIDERRLEEEFLDRGGDSSLLAPLLARAKALDVSVRRPQALCFGADQTLALEAELFHKAADLDEAAQNLRKLVGRTHVLNSALCIARGGEVVFETTQKALMTMRALDDGAIWTYLAAAGPAVLSSVGAYQVEGLGIHLFVAIEGDQSTILGLPLLALLKWLRGQGCLAL